MRHYYLLALLSFGLLSVPLFTKAADGKAFAITGEQVNHPIPDGWKLAWMDGKPDGRYFAEYIPVDEDINSWSSGYLAIERIPMPSPETMEEVRKTKTSLAEIGLHHFIDQANKRCNGKHEEMSQRVNTFNNTFFAVGGGFCSRYGTMAPFGEGAFVAFLEGRHNIFRIQYAWRPKSENNKDDFLPWRIAPEIAKVRLEAIKATTLCGSEGQPACQMQYQ